MAKIELAILVGAESKAWLEKAEQLVNRMEELTKGKKSGKRSEEGDESDAEESEEDVEEESTSKKGSAAKSKKKVQKANDDDDDDSEDDDDSDSADDEEDSDDDESETSEEDSDDDGEPVKKAKGKKPKKVTHEDAQAACKERVKREVEDNGLNAKEARTLVTGILKKKFKVSSVSDLDEDQYAEVVKAMKKV